MLAYLLIAGSVLWAAGEAMSLAAGAITVASGSVACVGMTLVGAAIWTLKDLPGMGRPGRVGIAMTGFAAFSLAMVNIIVLSGGALGEISRGELGYDQIVYTPIYVMAVVFAIIGLAGFAIHFRQAPGGRGWSAAFAVLAVLFAARLFFAGSLTLHAAAALLLAAALAVLALKRAGRL